MPKETREPAPFRIGIVADDLTGALDAGAGFAKAGMRVRVPLVPIGAPLDFGGADAMVINTASREGTADDAYARTRAATIALLRGGVTLLYKKVDSALRGHPGPELAGMLSPLPAGTRALVAPAFPAQGRVTVNGVQLIHGRPATRFDGRLIEAFSEPASEAGSSAASSCDFHDAADEADLRTVAKKGVDDGVRVWVGSAGLAAELVPALIEKGLHFDGHDGADGGEPDSPWHEGNPVFVIAGSVHPVTIAQVAEAATNPDRHLAINPQQREGWPSASTFDRAFAGDDATEPTVPGHATPTEGKGSTPLIVSTHADVPDGTLPDEWIIGAAALLTQIAEALMRRLVRGSPMALVVTGGETAQTLFAALGATAIDVTGEVLPGIPTGMLHVGGRVVPIVTKSGGFGAPSDLATIIAGAPQLRA
jgi:uncharacterized protein YgbK (DUF1537 family)